MKTKEELVAWLGSLGLSADQQKLVLPALGSEAVMSKVGESVMMRADYSRKSDELKKQEQKNTEYYTSVTGWKADADETYQQTKRDLEAANNNLAIIRNRVNTLKTSYAIDDEDLKDLNLAEGTAAAAAAANTSAAAAAAAAAAGNSGYLPKEQYERDVNTFRGEFPFIPAILNDVNNKHMALFGKPIENQEALVDEALKTKRDIKTLAAEKYGFAAREKEIADASLKTQLEAAREEGRKEAMNENANPAAPRLSSTINSPILSRPMPKGTEEGGAVHRPDPQRGLKAALSTFGTHDAGAA